MRASSVYRIPVSVAAALAAGTLLLGCSNGRTGASPAPSTTVPWGLSFLPDRDALVRERNTADIVRVTPDEPAVERVYQMPGVAQLPEGGLLGLAASPTFTADQLVYAYYTASDDSRIVRFRLAA